MKRQLLDGKEAAACGLLRSATLGSKVAKHSGAHGVPVAIAVVAELESLAKLARAEEKIGHFEALGGFAGDRGSVSPAWRDWKWWLGAQPPAVLESARRREFGTGDGAYAYTTSRGLGMATG